MKKTGYEGLKVLEEHRNRDLLQHLVMSFVPEAVACAKRRTSLSPGGWGRGKSRKRDSWD